MFILTGRTPEERQGPTRGVPLKRYPSYIESQIICLSEEQKGPTLGARFWGGVRLVESQVICLKNGRDQL